MTQTPTNQTNRETIMFAFKNGTKLELGHKTLNCEEGKVKLVFDKINKYLAETKSDHSFISYTNCYIRFDDIDYILFQNDELRK